MYLGGRLRYTSIHVCSRTHEKCSKIHLLKYIWGDTYPRFGGYRDHPLIQTRAPDRVSRPREVPHTVLNVSTSASPAVPTQIRKGRYLTSLSLQRLFRSYNQHYRNSLNNNLAKQHKHTICGPRTTFVQGGHAQDGRQRGMPFVIPSSCRTPE